MADDIKAPGLDFGALIAFVAPGFVALLATSYQLPYAGELVAEASKQQQNVGVFLFGLLASLSLGLVVSGLRSLVVDIVINWLLGKFWDVRDPAIRWKEFTAESVTKLLVLRDNFYRYYQFYANMAVAVALWAASRTVSVLPGVSPLSRLEWGLVVAGVAVLVLAAARQLAEYYRAKTVLAA